MIYSKNNKHNKKKNILKKINNNNNNNINCKVSAGAHCEGYNPLVSTIISVVKEQITWWDGIEL